MAITAFFVVLVTLGVLETLAPAFEGPSSRVNRWPSNFGLMLLDQSIQSAAPISGQIGLGIILLEFLTPRRFPAGLLHQSLS